MFQRRLGGVSVTCGELSMTWAMKAAVIAEATPISDWTAALRTGERGVMLAQIADRRAGKQALAGFLRDSFRLLS